MDFGVCDYKIELCESIPPRREQAARDTGLTRLIADTLTPNVEMRSLHPNLGVVELNEPIRTTTYLDQPMLPPHLHFFAKDL